MNKKTSLMMPLMLIISDVQNSECSKYMDYLLKPKLLIHSTNLTYYIHHYIIAFEYLDYDMTI